ncbi:acetate--CoA ligase family protein [Streptosporangium sp. NPDC051022]|uniref:acetate--CoA ligase family protein n=1 Tax=Streptosporangium sp. NPDC051022 TaxID=3155752 RepID=UPI00343C75C4
MAESLDGMLDARSVALVGASEKSGWSRNAFANLRLHSPHVTVHCVNPRGGRVHGVTAAERLADIGEPVDLAYVMAPRDAVPDVIAEAGVAGIRNAVVLTAGFGETDEGRAHQRRLTRAAAEGAVHVLGPNTSGFVNVRRGLVACGLSMPVLPDPGGASFVLHSGGLMKPVMNLARGWGIGVGFVGSSGNEAALSAVAIARHLVESGETGAVGMFLEAFRDPAAFRELAARAVELDRPVVVLTVGRSEVAREAARSHTGALTGDAEVTAAVLGQLGVVQVHSVEELVVTTGLLSRRVRPRGNRIGVVGASGGVCGLSAETAGELGLELPALPPSTAAALGELMPDFSRPENPVDVTGFVAVQPDLPLVATRRVAETAPDSYDALLFQAFMMPRERPAVPGEGEELFRSLLDVQAGVEIPIILQSEVAAPLPDHARELFGSLGLVWLPGVHLGLRALANAVAYTARRDRIRGRTAPLPSRPTSVDADGTPWSEARALALLDRCGVPVVPSVLARGEDEAVSAAAGFDGPVALKICSPDIAHKSDVGGVELGVLGEEAVRAAYRGLRARVAPLAEAGARIDGVIVAPMRPAGVELVAGVRRDPVWGAVVVVGLGGVFVEVLRDVAIRALPVTADDVADMLAGLRGRALLDGVRGRAPADVGALVDVIVTMCAAVTGWCTPTGVDWDSVEINPLLATGDGAEALDALVTWTTRDETEENPHDRP